VAVACAVCVFEHEPGCAITFDEQATRMRLLVVGSAERDQPIGMMISAFALRMDVVHVDEDRVATAGHDAAVLVAMQDESPRRGWDLLGRSRRRRGIELDALRIALRRFNDGAIDDELSSGTALRRPQSSHRVRTI